jgi:hypothetical protein
MKNKPQDILNDCFQVLHPQICIDGTVHMSILGDDWKPVLTMNYVIFALQLLFVEPSFDSFCPEWSTLLGLSVPTTPLECTNCKKFVPRAEWDAKYACRYHGLRGEGYFSEIACLWLCCNSKDRNAPGCQIGSHSASVDFTTPQLPYQNPPKYFFEALVKQTLQGGVFFGSKWDANCNSPPLYSKRSRGDHKSDIKQPLRSVKLKLESSKKEDEELVSLLHNSMSLQPSIFKCDSALTGSIESPSFEGQDMTIFDISNSGMLDEAIDREWECEEAVIGTPVRTRSQTTPDVVISIEPCILGPTFNSSNSGNRNNPRDNTLASVIFQGDDGQGVIQGSGEPQSNFSAMDTS